MQLLLHVELNAFNSVFHDGYQLDELNRFMCVLYICVKWVLVRDCAVTVGPPLLFPLYFQYRVFKHPISRGQYMVSRLLSGPQFLCDWQLNRERVIQHRTGMIIFHGSHFKLIFWGDKFFCFQHTSVWSIRKRPQFWEIVPAQNFGGCTFFAFAMVVYCCLCSELIW